ERWTTGLQFWIGERPWSGTRSQPFSAPSAEPPRWRLYRFTLRSAFGRHRGTMAHAGLRVGSDSG
ncbi:MAG TPA: hypothetical protein VFQ48_03210, partial [Pseudonocardiaceae bacterium]|nr:hypothetical protein [Pseudonocardiaceae bacterium]